MPSVESAAALLQTEDIEIGAVEIKDGATDQRATVNTDGSLKVSTAGGDGVIAGQGRKVTTTAGTAVALATTTTCKWVLVCALTANTQQVNVGLTGVIAAAGTSTGVPLLAGASVVLPVANVATVFVDSRVDAEGVSFIYGN